MAYSQIHQVIDIEISIFQDFEGNNSKVVGQDIVGNLLWNLYSDYFSYTLKFCF